MHPFLQCAAFVGGGLFAAAVPAQSWQQAIARQWPGAAILKVGDQEFAAFAKRQPLAAKGGHAEFVRQQLQAYGLTAGAVLPRQGAIGVLHPRRHDLPESVRQEVEPNDTPAGANALPCGDHMEASIGVAGDRDWYGFTLATAGHVFASVGTGPDGQVLDSVMTLYDASQVLLAYNDDENRSWLSSLDLDLPAGNYLLMVRGYGAADVGNYSLDLTCGPPGGGLSRVAEAAEPNGPLGIGTPTVLPPNAVADGNTGGNGDTDWFTFTLPFRALIRAETGPGLSGTANADTVLNLWDQAGANQLATDDDGAPGNYSLLSLVLPAGTYHLDVQGYGGTNTGSYTLMLLATDLSAALGEGPEPNGDPLNNGAPSVFACDSWGEGELNPGGDDDWWLFGMAQDGFVTVENFGGPLTATSTPIGDPILRLYDSSSTLLGMDDDSGPNLYSRLAMFLPAGLYYIEMRGFGTATGSYALHLACNHNAQYVAHLGGCRGSNNTSPEFAVRAYEVPLLGSTFVAAFHAAPANAAVFGLLGLSRTLAAGTLPLPFDLAPFGAPGCRLEVDPLSVQLLFANASGDASWPLSLPYQPAVLGLMFHQQGMVLDPAANALGLTASNSGSGLVHLRP